MGFKPSGERGKLSGFHETIDHYNILVHDEKKRAHPRILGPYLDEAHHVMDIIRNNVLKKILSLVAMILEVPEEIILETHALGDQKSTEYYRYVRLHMCGLLKQQVLKGSTR